MMRRLLTRLGLPLLAKELIEQAARKRTYVVRVLYAIFLFFLAFIFFYRTLQIGAASPMAVLGRGREMFATLVNLQFAGIYLFLPAITCSVLTQEKERASLQLLFLTRLGPWAILFEKLLSRLIPMFFYLLLSLPLLAFAYTLGGISPGQFWNGVGLLALAVVQMGTLALACSAFFRTTSGAFIWSYLLSALMLFGPALGWLAIYTLTGMNPNRFAEMLTGSSPFTGSNFAVAAIIALPFFGPGLTLGPPGAIGLIYYAALAAHAICVLTASGLFLLLARAFLVRRAFLPPRNVILNVFKAFDRIFLKLNNNPVTRNIVFTGKSAALPQDDPVGWRETTKRSLGVPRYLLRVFIALEVPIAGVCVIVIMESLSAAPLPPMLFLLWPIAVLMVSAQSASLIAAERSHQTLDVLCVTPIEGRDIVLQKYGAARRLMMVLLVPFFTIFFFECAMKWRMPGWGYGWERPFSLPLYLACSFLSVGIYLPLAAWLSLLIGLKVRMQARAVIAAMTALVAWCVLPVVLVTAPLDIIVRPAGIDRHLVNCSALLSPAVIVPFNEYDRLDEFSSEPWIPLIVNFVAYGACLLVLRWFCLSQADRMMGRLEAVTERPRVKVRESPGIELAAE